MAEQIRLVLVDDQQLVRAGLAMVIAAQDDMVVVGEAGDGAEAGDRTVGDPAAAGTRRCRAGGRRDARAAGAGKARGP